MLFDVHIVNFLKSFTNDNNLHIYRFYILDSIFYIIFIVYNIFYIIDSWTMIFFLNYSSWLELDFWICGLLPFIRFQKYLAIIFLSITFPSSLLLYSPPSLYFPCLSLSFFPKTPVTSMLILITSSLPVSHFVLFSQFFLSLWFILDIFSWSIFKHSNLVSCYIQSSVKAICNTLISDIHLPFQKAHLTIFVDSNPSLKCSHFAPRFVSLLPYYICHS